MKQQRSGTPTSEAIKRAFAILEVLDSSRRGMNISELSRRLNIPKSSTHVVVLTLERLGYVSRDPARRLFLLAFKANILGHGLIKTLRLADLALPHMSRLASDVKAAVHLTVSDGEQGICIQKAEAAVERRLGTYVGRRMDLHCTAAGKAILAFGPPSIRERALSQETYICHTSNTITTPRVLERELAIVRRQGYAVDDEEEEIGIRCVAVPVFDASRHCLAALSVTATVRHIPLDGVEAVADALKATAVAIGAAWLELPASPQAQPDAPALTL